MSYTVFPPFTQFREVPVYDGVPKLSVNRVFFDGIEIYIDMQSSDISSARRRVSRTATLDGGCVVQDFGGYVSDRTLHIVADVNLTQATIIKHAFEINSLHEVATIDGEYTCVGVSYKDTFGRIEMDLDLITENAKLTTQIAAAYASGAS